MITVDNRRLNIPQAEKRLGMEADNLVTERRFILTDLALAGYVFKLDVRKASGAVGVVALDKTVDAESVMLVWRLSASELDEPGTLTAQLCAYNPDGAEVWHSATGGFVVEESIRAEDAFPSPLPTEFHQLERKLDAAVESVEETARKLDDYYTEEWEFVLDDGTTVTKKVVLSE